MKLQTGATQVALRTSQLMRAGSNIRGGRTAVSEPAWYKVVLANPPTHQLLPKLRKLKEYVEVARAQPEVNTRTGMYTTRIKAKFNTRAGHLYKLSKIEYPEDKIRRLFYTNHPWEMARPRNMIENSGRSVADCDWSNMRQPTLRLSGENVVQRTLWLASQPAYMKEHGKDWYEAYKQARLEFYRLRIDENAKQQVAAEEAIMNGAVFGPSSIEHGVAVEQKVIDKYIDIAKKATELKAQRRAGAQTEAEEPSSA
ncbi:37S ribosomal protein S25, mitochondrial [Wickerhamiella sorbophila]|uniref:37S ribosomal protein S25, mitochondrial n=1 Tax=Wickerhamiella sorbophila TaxID=45607 RepID=A0A2T0FGG4_9ASCO|nr:37S ribosomal protein S25, mitochondrial [Wickerhamiella sorbophila]PRT54081.1 37S ribosomal protein S25, mitochondrial [Wickerhamiella sorbophila]